MPAEEERPEVRLLLSFLRLLADPSASVDLYALAASDLYDVGGEDLAAVSAGARRRRIPLRDFLAELSVALLGPRAQEGGSVPHQPSEREGVCRLVDDSRKGRPIGSDERVSEVDRDRRDRDAPGHPYATLDGQMSRNGQYVHESALGFGV